MPRKTLKQRNRIKPIIRRLIGTENSDYLMQKIIGVLSKEDSIPSVGKYYTFVYYPKTPNIRYDAHPLVAVTDVFSWGFRGINFHWREVRQYTWAEVVDGMYPVYPQEIEDLRTIPYKKIRMS